MAVKRRVLLLGFVVALFLGTAVYLRIWAIDSNFTTDDREILRRQFERANIEAMDESAEWRMKYDGEVEKTRQCQDELMKAKVSIASANRRSNLLHKENDSLQKQLEALKQKIGVTGDRCNCSRSSDQHQQ